MKTLLAIIASLALLAGCGGNVESATTCPPGDTCTADDAGDAVAPEVSMVEGARLLCVAQVCERGECGQAPADDCIGETVTCDKCGDR